MNVCGSCGVDFSSIRAFDTHRVGKHAYTFDHGLMMNPPREDGRRCLSDHELEAAGFVQNSHGRWGLADEMCRARRRFVGEPRSAHEGQPA